MPHTRQERRQRNGRLAVSPRGVPDPRKSGSPVERRAPTLVGHLLMFFGLVVVSGVFAAVSGGRSESGIVMSDSLLGIWKTTAPRYAGRFFELATDIVVFGTGDGGAEVHSIATVEAVPEDQLRLYTVWYRAGETEESDQLAFRFYHDPVQNLITLKHQEDIPWTNIGQPLSVPKLIGAIEEGIGSNGELSADPDAEAVRAYGGRH